MTEDVSIQLLVPLRSPRLSFLPTKHTNQAKTNQSSIRMKRFGLLGVFVGSQDFDLATAYDIVGVMEIATNYRYIVKTEEIRGGNARIEGTRIGVHDLVGVLQNGETIESMP